MDPQLSIGDTTRDGVFEGLVGQDNKGKVIPALATSWKNIDEKTWQFKLAQGRKFHDGNPVTAEDVKFSYERAIDPALKLGILVRALTIEGAQIVDPQTINIITKGPDPLLLKRAALVSILEKAAVDKPGGDEDLRIKKPIGTGPFMVKEFVPNQKLVLVPSPYFTPKPAATEVIITNVPEVSARIAGLKTGELDLIYNVTIDQATELKNAGYQIVNFNQGQSIGGFLFATLTDSPIQSKLVRQAINYAVDKDTIVKQIYKGFTKPTGQLLQTDTFGYNPNVKPYPYDPAKAKQLLAQAGYPNGFKMKLDIPTNVSDAQTLFLFIQSQLKEVGIDADMEVSGDSAFFLDRWYGRVRRGELLSGSLINSPAMDADFALTWFRGTEQEQARRYNNPEFDAAYLASTTELDEKKREALLQKAVQIMYDDPPWLYLVDGVRLWAATTDLQNVTPRPLLSPDMSKITHK